MKRFYSGYLVGNYYLQNIDELKGRSFKLIFEEPYPSNSVVRDTREVVILAMSIQTATKVSRLINASLCLLDAHKSLITDDIPDIIEDSSELDGSNKRLIGPVWSPDIFKACKIACKASLSKKLTYSIFKYKLGCSLHSNCIMDLDPSSGIRESISPYPDDHIRFGYAIVIFYSIIEELGVEVRANNNNPSFINGCWNTSVKSDLETRLKKMGVDINQPIYWDMRNTPTKNERKKKPNVIQKAEWASGYVRDSQIAIIDAISIISYLRSRVAAHSVKNGIGSLSIHDVANANFLSRRILLEHLKIWKELDSGV